ncbi:hypothetical protein Ciccas_003450 [Cichlidogyrus casuarinus]|uniref:Maturase K n=1 Tax=Cichlidogyrus casuarinus TaxID=1844966 RepID=A0ABD2QF36_9PLAT
MTFLQNSTTDMHFFHQIPLLRDLLPLLFQSIKFPDRSILESYYRYLFLYVDHSPVANCNLAFISRLNSNCNWIEFLIDHCLVQLDGLPVPKQKLVSAMLKFSPASQTEIISRILLCDQDINTHLCHLLLSCCGDFIDSSDPVLSHHLALISENMVKDDFASISFSRFERFTYSVLGHSPRLSILLIENCIVPLFLTLLNRNSRPPCISFRLYLISLR